MKKITSILSLFVAGTFMVSCCGGETSVKSYNEGINIIPQPQSLTLAEGEFKLKRGTKFNIQGSDELETVVDYFATKINQATGFNVELDKNNAKNVISITVDPEKVTTEEGYTLDVTKNRVDIVAKTPQGAFYGMQSFMQLLPAEIESPSLVEGVAWCAPAVSITDTPRFKYRGMHLDVTRHFFDMDFVKKQIDVIAMLKINRLHWHLTEDQLWTVEIKKYPKLVEVGAVRTEPDGSKYGGYYTQEQIKEVVKYANERFVDVIPEIELPGHGLAALTAYPEYSCTGGPFVHRPVWGVEPDVFCAGNDATFEFLENIISEVAPLFTSEYFHIGGDECPKDRWKVCPKCQARMKKEGLKDEFELQSYFVQRIEKHVNKLGKKLIGWDEILEGGIAPSATIMSWRGEEGGIEAANADHDVIMTPGNWLYLDHYQGSSDVEPVAIGGYTTLEETYSYNPVPAKINPDKVDRVIGVQANLWSEYMYTPELVEYRAYPRIAALSEIAWTEIENKDYTDFERRINNMYVRLDGHNINYHIPLPEGPVAAYNEFIDNVTFDFNNTRDYPMVYTTDGTEPTAASTQYSEPITFSEDATLKIATLLPSGKLSTVRTLTAKKSSYSAAATDAKKGYTVSSVKGYFNSAADFKDAKFSVPKKITKITNYPSESYKNPSVEIYEGFFEVPADDVYTIATGVTQLWIDGVLVVDNDQKVARHDNNKSTKALAKGSHSFKMIMNNTIVGGWPHPWNAVNFSFKASSDEKPTKAL